MSPGDDLQAMVEAARRLQFPREQVRALAAVAAAQGRAGDRDGAAGTLEEARAIIGGMLWNSERAQGLVEIASARMQMGDQAGADAAFAEALTAAGTEASAGLRWMAMRDLAEALVDSGRAEAARAAYAAALDAVYAGTRSDEHVRDVRQLAQAQRRSVEKLARASDFTGALWIAREIENDRERAESLVSIAAEQTRAGQFAAALATAEEIGASYEPPKRRPIHLITFGEMEEERRLAWHLPDMRARARQQVAVAQARAGDLASALTTARESAPSLWQVHALGVVAVACRRAGDSARARAILGEAMTAADHSGQRDTALNWLATTLARMGETAAALQAAYPIADEWQRIDALREIVAGQVRAGDDRAARTTFASALKVSSKPEAGPEQVKALLQAASTLADAGDPSSARAVFAAAVKCARSKTDPNRRIWDQVEAVLAQAGTGDFLPALETARAIEDPRARDHTLQEMIRLLARAGRFEDALALLPEIGEDYKQRNGLESIVEAQMRSGRFDEARAAADQIEDGWSKTWRLGYIARAQAQAGQRDAARATFAAAAEVARTVQYCEVQLLGVLTDFQVEVGETELALATCAVAGAIARREWSEKSKAQALLAIGAHQMKAGAKETARETYAEAVSAARRIEEEYERAEVMKSLAVSLAAARDFAGALKAVAETGPSWCDRSTLNWHEASTALEAVAAAQARLGEFGAALETADRISSDLDRDRALGAIATRQAEVGQFAGALATAERIKWDSERDDALEDIVRELAHAGDLALALETAHRIGDAHDRADALGAIAEKQAEAGDPAALQTLQGIDPTRMAGEYHLLTRSLLRLARVQAAHGQGELALQTAAVMVTERDSALTELAAALARAGDRANWKRLLISCSYRTPSAFLMCGLLAQLYPEQAAAVARVIEGG